MRYFFCYENNFGDIFNKYFINKIIKTDDELISNIEDSPYFLFVGSLIHERYVSSKSIICGIGIGSMTDTFPKPLYTPILVRGPFTRSRFLELGYECQEIYGDPMIILPLYYTPPPRKIYDIGFIPHKIDTDKFREILPIHLPYTWTLIDLTCDENDIENIIDEIYSCRKTVSSSLHGLIASHAYNIPTMWIDSINPLFGDGVKYLDYYASLNIHDVSSKPLNLYSVLNDVADYPQPTKLAVDNIVSNVKNMINEINTKFIKI